jgi:pyruvate formate lyase activating enzyme
MEIKGFLETSLLDWDGKIVATVFLPGCNFRCPFCHNTGLTDQPEQYETIPLERIEQHLAKHRDFLDGICISGGEPSIHEPELFDFINRIKKDGWPIKLDTNGTNPKLLQRLIAGRLIDCLAMDIKGPLDENYMQLTGVNTGLAAIEESIKLIMASGIDYEFRTTVVPGVITPEAVQKIAARIKGAKKYVLQQFVPANCRDPKLRSRQPESLARLQEMQKIAAGYVEKAAIRGA